MRYLSLFKAEPRHPFKHISQTSLDSLDATAKKANNSRAFLQRNIKQCSGKTNELRYNTLFRLILEYASVIGYSFTYDNIWKLEMAQHIAARMVFSYYRSTSSVTPMLQLFQWPTLQERRTKAKVYMMYHIVYSLVDIQSSHLAPTLWVRGHNIKFLMSYARTFIYQRSLQPSPDSPNLFNTR